MDGMTVQQLPEFLKQHWPVIREQLLSGTYVPQPVKRVEIPKPDGGVRKLGIPTVLDRFIQQAVMQVLQRRWDRTFSDHSYGFRPGRSAHQAVEQAQQYMAAGYRWVVDLDLEKFFDRVNHDKLMAKVAERVSDKGLLTLIRAFLRAGVMEGGLVSPVDEGTPQGGPLSPLLSNIVLNELDRELERRGLRFARYADDCNVYVRSRRAGERVMESITRFITAKLKLKVNQQKSAVARPWERKFLGFSFTNAGVPKRRIAPKAVDRFKGRVRELTRRTRGVSTERMAEELTRYLRGWVGYFGNAKRRLYWRCLNAGSVAGFGLRSGSSGSGDRYGLPNCGNGEWEKISPRKRRAVLTARGGWRTARLSALRCPMRTSTRSGFRD
jgi:RNA-directed DNA polymerase